ncbi:MAG: LytTR family transcriptional regulator [Candidatus Gastranaerophilales bacterium]|nr:LytTR family transcriptional regulator [Candidatus Gastranaerophilales bacterium]
MTNAIGDDNFLQYSFVEGFARIQVDDILYIETNRHKNFFYTQKGVYSIYKKLGEIEEDLRGRGFVRVHQSYLVNMKYIEKINSYILTLTTGKELSVPKSRYQEVKRQYAMFHGET